MAPTDGPFELHSPLAGTVARVDAPPGSEVAAGATVVTVESMKMEHGVDAPAAAVVAAVLVEAGHQVDAGDVVARLALVAAPGTTGATTGAATPAGAGGQVRDDLAAVVERHRTGLDEARPEAVARRRRTGQRTARENVDALLDPGSLVEYGPLAIAAQRRRRPLEELIARTPADGMVAGVGTVDGRPTAVLSYDYTVLAGTQGQQNHRKKDRLFEVIRRQRLPVVFFTEGGGGRPGDTDVSGVSGLDCLAFELWAQLSGLVPMVGVVSGRCFAGNAALLGCCDVVIATEGANIGMGGPAMIEGGGLGAYSPDDIGPVAEQHAGGVVDVLVADEAAAVDVARRYLSLLSGDAVDAWACPDQTLLRDAVPPERRRAYDVRALVAGLVDDDSLLELRDGWGPGMVTALARVEGRPLGIVANDPTHLGGAIDADAAEKAARFLQLCDGHGLPVVTLCDTPGFMVGPEAERTGLVRKVSRLFVQGANLSVPLVSVVTRKAYGLGAQAMCGGSLKAPLACVSWPTGEFGGMGLEGAVRLGYRKELEAERDDAERAALFDEMVERAYEHGKALNIASHFEIDDVIDPADTRRWIATTFAAAPPARGERPCIDTW